MLRLVRDAEHTATELAAAAGLSASAASQHLKLLVSPACEVRVDAQRRLYRANLARLAELRAELDELWSDRLKTAAEAEPPDQSGAADRRGERPA